MVEWEKLLTQNFWAFPVAAGLFGAGVVGVFLKAKTFVNERKQRQSPLAREPGYWERRAMEAGKLHTYRGPQDQRRSSTVSPEAPPAP